MGGLAPSTGMDQNAAGNPDGQGDPAAATMGKIRDLGQMVTDLTQTIPAASAEFQQIQQILKRVIVKVAQRGPQQTPSASQVPGS